MNKFEVCGFVARYCWICGTMYNGYKPLTHKVLEDCDKKSIKKYKKEMKKLAEEILKENPDIVEKLSKTFKKKK